MKKNIVKTLLSALLLGQVFTVNSQSVTYQPLYTSTNFNSSINVNLPVGITEGKHSVSPTGAAIYSIPIKVSPGTCDMVPQLSINYNSQSDNGICGYGWSLSGLSSILLAPQKTHYTEGENNPGSYTGLFNFISLDGVKLYPSFDPNGGPWEYYAEVSDFGYGKSSGQYLGDSYQYISKNGQVSTYGGTPDASDYTDNGNNKFACLINQTTDEAGNYIEYHYSVLNKERLISEIKYTGNSGSGILPYNSVKFYYGFRSDANTLHTTRKTFFRNNLLTKIEVISEGNIVRAYNFKYSQSQEGYSLLKEISESGANGTQLNPTIIKYGDVVDGSVVTSPVSGTSEVTIADVDGDGINDIIKSTTAPTGNYCTQYNTGFKIYSGNVTGTNFQQSATLTMPNSEVLSGFSINGYMSKPIYANIEKLTSTDIDGDGRDDIVRIESFVNWPTSVCYGHGENRTKSVTVNYSNGSGGFSTQNYSLPNVDKTVYEIHTTNYYQIADFNGDKLPDILMTLRDVNDGYKNKLFCFNKNINGFVQINCQQSYADEFDKADMVTPGDFDGDGDQEIYLRLDNVVKVYRLDIVGSNCNVVFLTSFNIGSGTNYRLWTGDFNGDGITDLLMNYFYKNQAGDSHHGYFNIAFGNGSGFTAWQPLDHNNVCNTGGTYSCMADMDLDEHNVIGNNLWVKDWLLIGDFNGDGKSDILHEKHVKINGQYVSRLDVYYSQGYDVWSKPFTYIQNFLFPDNNGKAAQVADLNGDNKADVLASDHLVTFRTNQSDRVVEKVRDGIGKETRFTYESLNSSSRFSTDHFQYGQYFVTKPLPVLGVIHTTSNGNLPGITPTDIDYYYKNAVFHRLGKGLMGYMYSKSVDALANRLIETIPKILVKPISGNYDRVFNGGVMTSEWAYASNQLLQRTANYADYKQSTAAGIPGIFVLDTSSNYSTNYITGGQTSSWMKYDIYGNVIQKTDKAGANTEQVSSSYSYVSAATFNNRYPTKPENVNVTLTRLGNTSSTADRFYYFPNGLQKGIDNHMLTTPVHTEYVRNGSGNIVQETVSASGLPSKVTGMSYDQYNRFIIDNSNPLGLHESTSYDGRWGVVVSHKDYAQNTTTNQYDEFGELTQINLPQGNSITHSKSWTVSNNVLYNATASSSGNGLTNTEFDYLGRKVNEYTTLQIIATSSWPGFAFKSSIVKKAYDALGNTASETQPHFLNENNYLTTTYQYDPLNRLTSACNQIGCTNYNYAYAGGNTTVSTTNPGGQTTSKTTDVTGKTVEVNDAAGSTYYSYDSRGSQTEVRLFSVAANPILQNFYDADGRKIKVIESNSGTKSYSYDSYGRLVSETNANSQAHYYSYDLIDRITSRSGPEGLTTYSYYNASQPGEGLELKAVTDYNGNTEGFLYTPFGKLKQRTSVIGSKTYLFNYTYDTWNRLLSTEYPTGLKIDNSYDVFGNWVKVANGSTVLYSQNSVDGMNHAVDVSRGNGLSTLKTYNYGLLTSITSPVQDYYLDWDYTTGNILQRKELSHNVIEQFTYDNLNRLTGSTASIINGLQGSALTLSYNTSGNISQKFDVGAYQYNSQKVNAVSYVSNAQGQIPVATQNITYTPFLKPGVVQEGNWEQRFVYDYQYDRSQSYLRQNGNLVATKTYLPDGFEVYNSGGTDNFIHYIPGPDGLCAIYYQGEHTDWYYPYADHLGSITALTDASGHIVYEQAFDPWVRYRNPSPWNYASIPPNTGFEWLRGFTGHEHMPQFGLINMNARLYDPMLGRMLSPDIFVDDTKGSQGLNRYTYANNNPLLYIDQDGNYALVDDGIAMLLGGVVNVVSQGLQGNIHSWGQGFAYFGVGAASGEATLYGGPIAGGAVGGLGNNLVGQLSDNGGDVSQLNYGNLFSSAIIGAATAYVGSLVGGALSPNLSGIASPVLKGALSNAVGGAGSGFVLGTVFGLAGGDDLSTALKAGGQGALDGFTTGIITGSVQGLQSSQTANVDAKTGRSDDVETLTPLDIKNIKSSAAENGIYGYGNNQPISIPKVIKFYKMMEDGTFNESIGGTAGKMENGRKIVEDGHHRTSAALHYMNKTGSNRYLKSIEQNGNWYYFGNLSTGQTRTPYRSWKSIKFK